MPQGPRGHPVLFTKTSVSEANTGNEENAMAVPMQTWQPVSKAVLQSMQLQIQLVGAAVEACARSTAGAGVLQSCRQSSWFLSLGLVHDMGLGAGVGPCLGVPRTKNWGTCVEELVRQSNPNITGLNLGDGCGGEEVVPDLSNCHLGALFHGNLG